VGLTRNTSLALVAQVALGAACSPGEAPIVPPPPHAGHYAAPGGTSGGDGSIYRPWDLATALQGAGGKIRPGDTLWVRGGTYRGPFRSTVQGTAGAPVIVRQFPGERSVIDGAGATSDNFVVAGDWSTFSDLEFTNSDPTRTTLSTASDFRRIVVSNDAAHTKLINLIIHDGGIAIYTFATQPDVEIYGCIIYNNGWQGPDRGHGHAVYVKNNTGPLLIRDNIMFNQFGWGIHEYSDSGSGLLNNIHVDGNVSFNNGTLSNNSTEGNMLVGGEEPVNQGSVTANLTFYPSGVGGTNVQLGYLTVQNESVAFQNNYIVGGNLPLDVRYWTQATVSGNTLYGAGTMVNLSDTTTLTQQWSGDQYYRDPGATAWKYAGTSYTFSGWQAATGLGATDQAVAGGPTAPWVLVRPNAYQAGRATIIVYNWTRQASVAVDASGVLRTGDRYEVRNVQDLFGSPLVSGTYGGGPLAIPMTAVQPPTPIGMASSPAPVTGPDFNVFLLTTAVP